MNIVNGTFAVTATAAALTGTGVHDARTALEVRIVNDGAGDVFVGGSGVTTSNGIIVAQTTEKVFTISGAAELYIVAGGNVTVKYLVSPLYVS